MGIARSVLGAIRNITQANKPVVVVEIGNDWLKIVEGSVSGSTVFVNKFSFRKLAKIKGTISDQIANDFRELGLDKQAVITFLPRHLVTSRILEVPSVDPKEINEILSLQIGKQTPYSKEEIISDYKIIGSQREGYTKVMLIIARRNLVDERLNAFEKNGIGVEGITLSSEGVCNWFNLFHSAELKANNSQPCILVDIDSSYSDFIVVNNKGFSFTKNILIGANHLIEDREAYQHKFVEELKHSKDIFSDEWKGVKITKLFLTGAAHNIKDLDVILSAQLDIPCRFIDSFKDFRLRTENPAIKSNDFRFISICSTLGVLMAHKGLGFNLIPNEMRIQKIMKEKRDNLTVLGILFSAIIMVLSFLMLINIQNKNIYLGQLKNKTGTIKEDSDKIEKMRLSLNLIRKRLDAGGDTLSLLNEIYKIVPKEIYLTNVTIERKKQAILRGRAAQMSDVFKFVTALEALPVFNNVKNNYATTKKENDVEFTDFEITANYENKKGY